MKSALILLLSFCFIGVQAQEIGLTTGSLIRKTNIWVDDGSNPSRGFTLGIYYAQPIYKRLALSTGLLYALGFTRSISFDVSVPELVSYHHLSTLMHSLEIPLDLNFRVTKRNATWPIYLSTGYRLNMILGTQEKEWRYWQYPRWHSFERTYELYEILRHSAVLGIEIRHQFSRQFMFTIGSSGSFTWVPGNYGFADWRVFLKFGYRLTRTKTKKEVIRG